MLHALPPSYRRRALVQVEALIAQAERDLARRDADRDGPRPERRLALLRRSRQFLLSDESSAGRGARR